MSKSILLVGATGFVGGKILNLIDDGNSQITLLSRPRIAVSSADLTNL